jgi:hypothetical protein
MRAREKYWNINDYIPRDELKLPLPQQDGPRLLSEGLASARSEAAAVELAGVEVELERLRWTRNLVRGPQRSGGGGTKAYLL